MGIYWVEALGSARHSTTHSTAPTRNSLALNIQSAQVERSCIFSLSSHWVLPQWTLYNEEPELQELSFPEACQLPFPDLQRVFQASS